VTDSPPKYERQPRSPRSFALKQHTADLVAEIAVLYDTSQSRIMEALINQYVPKLIEQQKAKIDRGEFKL